MVGKTMSSGTREGWSPKGFPEDRAAAEALNEWVAAGNPQFDGEDLDFRGSDLSDGDFAESRFSSANLAGVTAERATFYRADFASTDLSDANFRGADLVKAEFSETVLRSARFDGADLGSATLYAVDARGASFHGARLSGTTFLESDLRDADLSCAVLSEAVLQVTVSEATVLNGITGTCFGPVVLELSGSSKQLDGPALQEWVSRHGGTVEVLPPRGRKK
ncbi:pentapeptide repeat-containing protein [Streptomyces sp. NPDC007100]|uniref:pentapeptide repeat-containing protein n=1 Tax=Streptomyces sp. NPDC007100 TaxID=3155602 RepID=UPI0033CE5CF4